MAFATSSPHKKTTYTLTSLLFLFFFLFSIFLFSKRTLEPPISLYRDFFSQTASSSSSSPPPPSNIDSRLSLADPTPPPEQVDSPINQPISLNSQTEPKDFEISVDSVNAEVPAEVEEHPVADNGVGGEIGDDGGDLSVEKLKNCDLYMGTWVRDEEYPIYKPGSCPYVDEAFDCQSNGRCDTEYLKWRWKPDGCDLPRYVFYRFYVLFCFSVMFC